MMYCRVATYVSLIAYSTVQYAHTVQLGQSCAGLLAGPGPDRKSVV